MVILLMSFVFITIAVMLAPLFLSFILFKVLKPLFDEWLTLFISSSLIIVVVTVVIVLMLSLVMGKFESLLRFKICWQIFYTFPLVNWSLGWWTPQITSEVDTALSVTNLISILVIASLFKAVVQMIPMLSDALAQSNLAPFKGGFDSVMKGVNQIGAQVRSVASPAGLIDLAMAAKNRMSKDEKDENGQVRPKTTLDNSWLMDKAKQASEIVSELDRKILGGAIENKSGILDGVFEDKKKNDKKDNKTADGKGGADA
jgi:type IV secretory pathway VirB6-like protein